MDLFLKDLFTKLCSEFFPTQGGPSHASTGVNVAPQDYLTNPYGGFPTMAAHPTKGGYTSLLLGLLLLLEDYNLMTYQILQH